MKPQVFIFINGIMNLPGEALNWNDRAVTWTHVNRSVNAKLLMVAEKVEYFCGPIGRAFGQDQRAKKLTRMLGFYLGWDIVLVGHSNGAAVILDALEMAGWPRIEEVHFVSGACEADFDRNGLNDALSRNRIGKVTVYCGGKDGAMRYARSWFARLLGYGTLGLHGPRNVAASISKAGRVATFLWRSFGHSTCWNEDHFDATMSYFVKQGD